VCNGTYRQDVEAQVLKMFRGLVHAVSQLCENSMYVLH
jgi:hypothetical protein